MDTSDTPTCVASTSVGSSTTARRRFAPFRLNAELSDDRTFIGIGGVVASVTTPVIEVGSAPGAADVQITDVRPSRGVGLQGSESLGI